MQTIEVQSRILQASSQESVLPIVTLTFLEEVITIAELIERTVEEQIRELSAMLVCNQQEIQRALQRQYLTEEDVPAQEIAQSQVLETIEVQKAWRAFKKRAYLVIVDGKIAESLDERLVFKLGSKITFVRLTPLVGG